MNKTNVEKWKDGSIVDDWMKSKAYQRLQAYHPYLTFSEPSNESFILPNGKSAKELTSDTEALFILGKKAFSLLPQAPTVADFDEGYKGYFQYVDELRKNLIDSYGAGRFKVSSPEGKIFQPDFQGADNGWILNVGWNGFSKPLAGAHLEEVSAVYKEAFLFHVFYEIDNALIAIEIGCSGVASAIGASDALANAMAIESGSLNLQEARKQMSYRGAMERLARDPKQKEKSFILECWQKWQESPTTYRSKAEFARDMLTKCEHLTSQKKVEDWCREWEKANPAG